MDSKTETLSPQGARLEVPRLSMFPVRLGLAAWAQIGVSQIRGVMVGEGGGDNKPFLFFRYFALFFRTRPIFFRTRKTSTFSRSPATIFRSIHSILAYSTGKTPPPTGRSRSDPPPNPQPHPKMGFFMPAGPAVASGWACRNSKKIQNLNNNFQSY